ncbi:MAG: PD40 domain-containing protein [Gemmatimonadetes bacterium]|nr:PD40 domain-containing protein [Gemmatimonadota bacterium]
MNRTLLSAGVLALAALAACQPSESQPPAGADDPSAAGGGAMEEGALHDAREIHLRNVRQLTFEGQNAEAYFSFDGTRLTYQTTPRTDGPADAVCDQIYTMDLQGRNRELISTGTGRTTCSYFYPAGDRILFASTHETADACPAPPDFSRGYVWALYPSYDIYVRDLETDALSQLTDTPGYDAEATISPTGDRIIFTSVRDGDLDLYSMNLDGSDVVRLTDRPGYDGGAFYSADGSKIVWRADYPQSEEALAEYRALLADGLIRPSELEIWVMNADGTDKRQITDVGGANFGPYWHPDGEKIIFSSNHDDPQGREFDLYMVNVDGSGLERITYTPEFDGFPVFSPDGRYLVWGSNRANDLEGETNIFIAEWVP